MQNQPLLLILKNKNKREPEQIRTVRIFNFFIFLFFFMVTTLYQPVKKIWYYFVTQLSCARKFIILLILDKYRYLSKINRIMDNIKRIMDFRVYRLLVGIEFNSTVAFISFVELTCLVNNLQCMRDSSK